LQRASYGNSIRQFDCDFFETLQKGGLHVGKRAIFLMYMQMYVHGMSRNTAGDAVVVVDTPDLVQGERGIATSLE